MADAGVGDVKFNEVQHPKAVTPVLGGVGSMTIACLLHNTVQSAKAIAAGREGNGGETGRRRNGSCMTAINSSLPG